MLAERGISGLPVCDADGTRRRRAQRGRPAREAGWAPARLGRAVRLARGDGERTGSREAAGAHRRARRLLRPRSRPSPRPRPTGAARHGRARRQPNPGRRKTGGWSASSRARPRSPVHQDEEEIALDIRENVAERMLWISSDRLQVEVDRGEVGCAVRSTRRSRRSISKSASGSAPGSSDPVGAPGGRLHRKGRPVDGAAA